MTKKWFWGLLWLFLCTASLQAQSRESLLKAIQETSKWSPADKPVLYDEKNIGTLSGTRAPVLRRYGVSGVTVQNWRGPGGTVHLTLYEMLDATAAYGLFTLDRNIHQPG